MNSDPISRRWEHYQSPPSFVLGFHGCDASVGQAVLNGSIPHLLSSENKYDWLGTGIYFWEGNPKRALEFAQERAAGGLNSRGSIRTPFVIGAILNLGRCLDLRDSSSLTEVKASYEALRRVTEKGKEILPKNKGREIKLRQLDCAVINFFHIRRDEGGLPPYDTVRADFWEGAELYPSAGFREQDHIQICVRDVTSIVGYFRPIEQF